MADRCIAERLDVRPDRSRMQRPLFDASRKDFGDGDFPLNIQCRAEQPRARDIESEVQSTDAGAD